MLRGLEDRLERMVEGVFSRAFRSNLQPVEIGRRLAREIDTKRTLDASGAWLGPNSFTVSLAPSDHERFTQLLGAMELELVVEVHRHAAERSVRFPGRVAVRLVVDDALGTGRFEVESSFVEGVPAGAPPAYVERSDGPRLPLTQPATTLGRQSDCTVVLDDGNVSRRHAEIRLEGDSHRVVDLGSTNGTRVNGVAVAERVLADGDVLTLGATSVVYRRL